MMVKRIFLLEFIPGKDMSGGGEPGDCLEIHFHNRDFVEKEPPVIIGSVAVKQ